MYQALWRYQALRPALSREPGSEAEARYVGYKYRGDSLHGVHVGGTLRYIHGIDVVQNYKNAKSATIKGRR